MPPPKGSPDAAAARPDLRFLVRLPTAASSFWCAWWTAVCAWARRSGCGPTARFSKWKAWATKRPRPRLATSFRPARSASCPPTSRRFPTPRSATPSSMTRIPPPSRCPASKRSSPWCSPASIRWSRTSTACCATRWKSCGSTTAPSASSRRIPWRWASVSAAAFWACCTWRSCRSAWSASSIST